MQNPIKNAWPPLPMHNPFKCTKSTFPKWALALLLCITLNLIGCGSTPNKPANNTTPLSFDKSGPQQAALSKQYSRWINTPYKLGGLSKHGIDCSGFVHVIYRDVFNKKVPRSTQLLAKTGKSIAQKSLKFGDLVFFKTGRKQRHVGIYINNGNFIHASSSRGVMQSSLRSNYWSQHYWKAKRIL